MTSRPENPSPTPSAADQPDTRNLAARAAALTALEQVEMKGAVLDAALNGQPAWRALPSRDRAFAFAIAAAAIRRVGALDETLDAFLNKPLPDEAGRASRILRLAAAELLVLDGAAHAAVDAAVELMGADRSTFKYKGLANAVLRRITREGREIFEAGDPLSDLPGWLAARWVEQYGQARARAMTAARSGPPPLDLTLKPDENTAEWAQALGAQTLPTGGLRRNAIGDVAGLAGYEDGAWWAQDAAAALPAALLAAKPGERVADLCAAPGGKTLQLAGAGANVIAVDRSAGRLKRVETNLKRTGLSAELVAADAAQWRPDAPLDAVLLDAPCTATGTLRRRPDVAASKTESDIASLARVQARLLDNAAEMLKPGGRMIYCTCSLEPEEGERQIEALLKRRSDLVIDPVRPEELPELESAIDVNGVVRTTPDMWAERGHLDGFYIARLTRL
ncbi:MAG: RsmB/NOP family class I SAM-dependent RNA methyltransferase [Pseudomonadota bacterium]